MSKSSDISRTISLSSSSALAWTTCFSGGKSLGEAGEHARLLEKLVDLAQPAEDARLDILLDGDDLVELLELGHGLAITRGAVGDYLSPRTASASSATP
jgi:hypothetical protein